MGQSAFLGQFEGILQTDGYTAYDQIGGTRMVHAACWAHARRLFFEAVQLNPRDPVATPIVARMDELFAVDAEARRRVIGLTGRHALRQERAKPLLDDIRNKIEAAQVRCIAVQCTKQGLPIRAHIVEETYTIPGISGTGAEQ